MQSIDCQHKNLLNMFSKDGYITVHIKIKFVLDFAPNYAWVLDNKCYNMRTCRFIKQTRNNGSIGYIIDGKFKSCTYLHDHLIRPVKSKLPF